MALVLVPDTSQKFEMPSNDARKRRREEVAFIGTRYKKVRQIGEGTYGKVFLATDKETGAAVALKKIRTEEKEGFPITAIREIRILKSLNHPNIINLREIVRSAMDARNDYKGSIYMVFDYMEHDLCGLMERNKITGCHFSTSEVKCLMIQLLQGLQCCHEANIMHRDLKASNILVGEDGQLKLADFGLARGYDHNHLQELGMTNNVITLWYRPPELLLGAKQYTEAVDMWSAGCIFAEMLTGGRHLFMGKTETDMVDAIFSRLGIPTEETWPGVVKLEHWDKVNVEKPRPNTLQRWANKERVERGALALLEGLLQMNPARRTSAALALTADWFREDPLPCAPSEIRKRESSHEWVVKKRRSEIVHGSRAAGVHGSGGGGGGGGAAAAAPAVVRSSGIGPEQAAQRHRGSSRHHAPSTGDRVHRVPLQPPPPSRSPGTQPHPAAQHVPYPPPGLAEAPPPFGCAAAFHHPPPPSASARYHPPPPRLGAPQPPAHPAAFLAHPPPPHPPPQGPSVMPHR